MTSSLFIIIYFRHSTLSAAGNTVMVAISGADFYSSDLDCSRSVLKGEYERWKAKWIDTPQEDRPSSAIDALNRCPVEAYPKISVLLQIFATLPVTTSSAERTFSELRLLKTYMRSTMGEERLNGLTSMYVQREVSVPPEEVIELLALQPRKLGIVL